MTPFFWLKWGLRLVGVLLVAILVYLAVIAGRIWWVARQDDHPRSDAIVVLGASQYNGTPSPVFAARLDHAKALYDEHVAPRIVTVGSKQPGDNFTEAIAAQNYLVARGVPGNAILPVSRGHDTLQSMRAVHAAFTRHGWHSAVLVTDPWHCLRARTMARDTGIDAQTSPERTGPAVDSRGTEVRYIFRETIAYAYYSIFGNDNVHSTGAV
ncbi:MAG TPA: YdcF family protein [Mycobacteriales bacterium]|nr:YdcF family protein [Mycobacteriales bacterium]